MALRNENKQRVRKAHIEAIIINTRRLQTRIARALIYKRPRLSLSLDVYERVVDISLFWEFARLSFLIVYS